MKENFTLDVFGSRTEIIQSQGPAGHVQYKVIYDISRTGILFWWFSYRLLSKKLQN